MIDILVKAATLVAIIAAGYLAKRAGWVRAADFSTLSAIAFRITLPCMLVTSFDDFELDLSLLWITLAGLVIVALGQVIGWLATRRRPRDAQAFAIFHTSSCNIGLFAIPYLSSFVGPQAIVVAVMFDIGNSLAFGGLGYGWGTALAQSERRVRLSRVIRQVFASPVFVTYLFVLVLGLLGLHLPRPVIGFTSTVGAANTFVAMFMLGIGLQFVLPRAEYVRGLRFLGLRYAYMVAAALVVWFALPFDHLEKVILVLILVGPIATAASIFTSEAKMDVRLSALVISVSILIGIVTMPAVMLALGGTG